VNSNLERFLKAHARDYDCALSEIRNGRKYSHWMWYIFPQIKGLGYSSTSIFYAIADIEEAKAYMNNEILRKHMLEICQVLLDLESSDASDIFGWPDDMKLKSSMTLFALSNPECEVFQKVLDKFFDGEKDERTVELL